MTIRNAHKLYRFWGRTPPEQGDNVAKLLRAEVSTSSVNQATMYLYGPIDSWGGPWGVSASEMAAALNELPSDVDQIELHINSPGGEVFEGIAIKNLLKNHAARIVAVVDGLAASAASFLAASADELVMGENTELMIHDAWGLAIGNAKDMHDYGDFLARTSDNIASIYAAKAGGTEADWREYMLEESWFSAEEAVAAGLADRVANADEAAPDEPAARARFDTEALFDHAGRVGAPPPAPVPTATTTPPVPEATTAVSPAGADLSLRHRLNARRLGV